MHLPPGPCVRFEYVPVGHGTQAPALLAPTAVEKLPAPQSVQAALPLVVLYFPATQAVQEPAGPVKPALQGGNTQALTDVLPLGEVVPAGQVTHLSTLTPLRAHLLLHPQHAPHAA